MLFYKICGTLSKFEEPYQSSRWVDVDCVWKWLFWLSVRFQTNASTFFCQHPCKELLQSWAAPQLRSIGANVNMWLDPDWPCLVKDLQLQSLVLISMILAHRLVFMFSPMSSRKKNIHFMIFLGWKNWTLYCCLTNSSEQRTNCCLKGMPKWSDVACAEAPTGHVMDGGAEDGQTVTNFPTLKWKPTFSNHFPGVWNGPKLDMGRRIFQVATHTGRECSTSDVSEKTVRPIRWLSGWSHWLRYFKILKPSSPPASPCFKPQVPWTSINPVFRFHGLYTSPKFRCSAVMDPPKSTKSCRCRSFLLWRVRPVCFKNRI